MSAARGFNRDFLDILRAFVEHRVEFLVVGAHALSVHGIPRATGDLDLLVRASPDNAQRVFDALRSFGAPVDSHHVSAADFATPGTVYQIGLPPRRIDILTGISGVGFDEAHAARVDIDVDGMAIGFLGRESMLKNKRAAGRDKDLVDVRLLEKQRK